MDPADLDGRDDEGRPGPVTAFDDARDVLVRVTDELVAQQRTHGQLAIALPPIAALQLASLLQLLEQEVPLPTAHATLVATILGLVRDFFENCPTVLAVLADGDDPDPDGPRPAHFPPKTRH
jgi:hypothetical protein